MPDLEKVLEEFCLSLAKFFSHPNTNEISRICNMKINTNERNLVYSFMIKNYFKDS